MKTRKEIPSPMERLVIKQLDVLNGNFSPQRTDDLRPGVHDLIGMNCNWTAMWEIEDGAYRGQWAMAPAYDGICFPFAWVPDCDIDFVL